MRVLASVISAVSIASAAAFVPATPHNVQRSSTLCMSTTEFTGSVKWYNGERGFGFIEVDEGGPDMYVHATGLTFEGPLEEDDRVSFITEIDPRTDKPKAVNVARADSEAPAPVEEEQPESVVESVVEAVKEDLVADVKAAKSKQTESFQRARLAAQVEQAAKGEHISGIYIVPSCEMVPS